MSIFRKTFSTEISGSLAARQKAMTDRTADTIQYLNSRNSWIRMVSSVNVNAVYTTAEQNVLLGGALNNNKSLRSGVGGTGNEAYSNKTPSGIDYRLGIRPMPGITSIDIKSKSAYGSLREVVVHFQCWDIHQLEELELLYMRPGYTTLVEWGWIPYLDNNGKIVTIPPIPYDIINKPATELSVIAKDLYDKSLKSGGNYDALFGYIKNYQWSARPDGGYDCQTTIISTGEIVESLKVNYVRPDLIDYKMYDSTSNKGDGYLNPEFDPQGNILSTNFTQAYEKNTLAGVWSELFYKLLDPNSKFKSGGIFDTISTSRGVNRNDLWVAFKDLKFNHVTTNTEGGVANNVGTWNVYITLDVALEFINKYVTAKSSKGEPLVKFSLRSSDISSDGKELLCLAHPLQVSVDPSVCLINSPLWYQKSNSSNIIVNAGANTNVTNLISGSQSIVAALKAASGFSTNETDFINAVKQITSTAMFDAVEVEMAKVKPEGKSTLAELINDQFEEDNLAQVQAIEFHLKQAAPSGPGLNVNVKTKQVAQQNTNTVFTKFDQTGGGITISKGTTSNVSTAATVATGLPNALDAINILKDIKLPYFYNNDSDTELGIIRNIYVNLDFLYRTATDANIESQDHKEKNEISLYKYVKSIMTAINSSLGSMNNFEVHVDPIDSNVARVIDINYTAPDKQSNLFELQVQNLNSVVRNYTLQSQIFPEQSSMIAIGSQVNGGQLGIQNNTMIDFNKNLVDRIIPDKEFPQQNNLHTSSKNNIGASLANIIVLFANFKDIATSGAATDLDSLYSKAKNSLRDIIVYFQSTVKSSSASRSIIPIKFSFETDGIGGLVIGHLFKVNSGILPKGYKGANLAQTITGISHTVGNSDWTTKIDALNIILDDPANKAKFSTSVDIKTVVANAVNALLAQPSQVITSTGSTGGTGGTGNNNGGGTPPPVPPKNKLRLNKGSETRPLKDIYQIILHNTAGYSNAADTMQMFIKEQFTGAHYVIDRAGDIVQGCDLTANPIHANSANYTSVGIELSNIHFLRPWDKDKNGNVLTWLDEPNAFNKIKKKKWYAYTEAQRKNINSPKGTGGIPYSLGGWKYMGDEWFEDYTDAQLASLKSTIINIIKQCPNILDSKGKLNYYHNPDNILETVFGLPLGGKPPVKGKSYDPVQSVTSAGANSKRGIYTHATVKGGTHGDTHPSPKLLKMLSEVKAALNA
jgi:N-acetyl-anhydromuramyl-L-alanine amidase AmpD